MFYFHSLDIALLVRANGFVYSADADGRRGRGLVFGGLCVAM